MSNYEHRSSTCTCPRQWHLLPARRPRATAPPTTGEGGGQGSARGAPEKETSVQAAALRPLVPGLSFAPVRQSASGTVSSNYAGRGSRRPLALSRIQRPRTGPGPPCPAPKQRPAPRLAGWLGRPCPEGPSADRALVPRERRCLPKGARSQPVVRSVCTHTHQHKAQRRDQCLLLRVQVLHLVQSRKTTAGKERERLAAAESDRSPKCPGPSPVSQGGGRHVSWQGSSCLGFFSF